VPSEPDTAASVALSGFLMPPAQAPSAALNAARIHATRLFDKQQKLAGNLFALGLEVPKLVVRANDS